MTIRPGPQPQHSEITGNERLAFLQLLKDGAWTSDEATEAFGRGRLKGLIACDYLGLTYTAMGMLLLLRAKGRVAATGSCDKPRSVSRSINEAYQRLALKRLGWEVISDPEMRPSTTRTDLLPVRTDRGATVLVTAQFGTGRGCSIEKLQHLTEQWRSEALFRNLRVVVLTPNDRRGQRLQEREQSWLELVQIHPLKQPEGRLLFAAATDARGCETGRQPPDDSPLPPVVRQVLSLPRESRIEHALQSLQLDTVMSVQQLRRYYALDIGDLPGVPAVSALLHPCHARYGLEIKTRFFLAAPRMQFLRDQHLAHRAGVAEMRHQLEVPTDPAMWQLEPRSRQAYEQPDAIWHSPFGKVAIEFDTGSYTTLTIQKKRQTFKDRAFQSIIWGVPSPRRQQRLRQVFGEDVLLADWFKED